LRRFFSLATCGALGQIAATAAWAQNQTTSITASPAGSTNAGLHDLSPWSMFTSADLVVQGVMVGLAFASLVTWTIFVGKFVELALARRKVTGALRRVTAAKSLTEARDALVGDKGVSQVFVAAALDEARLSSGFDGEDNIKERVASRFTEITRAEARRVRIGMGLLATIGATSPFVGLFGTVWGIMNSFIGISKAQTTNLAVVAPGIAEALLATAIGLVAAIPAVIIYNYYARGIKNYLELVGQTGGAVGRQLSRDLSRDFGRVNAQQMSRAAE